MGKVLTAQKVKKLPVGTDIILIREGTGKSGKLSVIKSGRKKMLRGVMGLHEIVDRPGWHYEEAEHE